MAAEQKGRITHRNKGDTKHHRMKDASRKKVARLKRSLETPKTKDAEKRLILICQKRLSRLEYK